jgi:hypothetical protein
LRPFAEKWCKDLIKEAGSHYRVLLFLVHRIRNNSPDDDACYLARALLWLLNNSTYVNVNSSFQADVNADYKTVVTFINNNVRPRYDLRSEYQNIPESVWRCGD